MKANTTSNAHDQTDLDHSTAGIATNHKDFDHKFAASFAQIAFSTNRFIVHHMRRVMSDLDMDSETVIVWGSLAQLNYAHLLHPSLNYEAGREADSESNFNSSTGAKPARLVDLTQVTGMPKESVRRKLKELEIRSKIIQVSPRQWQIVESSIDEETFEFTKTTTRLLLETAKDITYLLNRAP